MIDFQNRSLYRRWVMDRRSDCPINAAVELFGDKWTLLIVRELFFHGKASFNALMKIDEGISSGILSDRLSRLVDQAIIIRRPNGADGRAHDYFLTSKGAALEPILAELVIWIIEHEMPELRASAKDVFQHRRIRRTHSGNE